MIVSETDLFIKAIRQGYVYFKDWDGKIHKGFVVEYTANLGYNKASLKVAYGVHYFFNWRKDLWIEDDEELIKDPSKHELRNRCYNYGYTTFEGLCLENWMTRWSLNKEDLE